MSTYAISSYLILYCYTVKLTPHHNTLHYTPDDAVVVSPGWEVAAHAHQHLQTQPSQLRLRQHRLALLVAGVTR